MAYDLIKISGLSLVTPDSGQDIVVGVGDYAKRINYNAVKADMVGTSPTYTTDTEPYLMRQTAHTGVVGKCALNKLIGGSLGWNQLVQALSSSWTSESGVTATYSNGVATIASTVANNGIKIAASSVVVGHKYLLTFAAMSANSYEIRFGYTSASGIQMKGQTTSSWKTFASVKNALATHSQVYIYGTTAYSGVQVQNAMILDLTQMLGSTIADYIYSLETATEGSGIAWLSKYIDLGTYHAYDAGSIQSVQATAHVTTGFNAWDEQWEVGNISTETGLPVTNATTIRSKDYIRVVPNTDYYCNKLGSGGIRAIFFYDANQNFIISYIDEFYPQKIFNTANASYIKFRTYEAYGTSYKRDICINISKPTGTPKNGDYVPYNGHTYPLGSDTLRGVPQLASGKLAFDGDEKYPDGTIKRKYGSRAYQSGDTSDGATMITDGTTTVYKLTTPTTESSTSYQKVQTIDADGTEFFTTSSPVPVGHETQTPDNILAALGWLGE